MIRVSYSIGPTLIARFILDLRGVNDFEETDTDHVTTINFIQSRVLGDLASPLSSDSTWTSGAGDVVEDKHRTHEKSGESIVVTVHTTSQSQINDLR